MGMTAAVASLAAIVGLGAVAVQGPATPTASKLPSEGAPAVAAPVVSPASAQATAPPPAVTSSGAPAAVTASSSGPASTPPRSSTTAPGAATSSAAPASAGNAAAAPRCDDGRWRGPDGLNVEGRPDGFDAGNRGAVYVWHDADGWHLRTTDVSDGAHHYTGTISLSAGARFTSFSTVRLERADRIWVDGDNVLHYDFTTYDGVDGVNFTVSACDGAREHEVLRFSMDYNGREDDPSRIALGDTKQHPDSATFAVTRSI